MNSIQYIKHKFVTALALIACLWVALMDSLFGSRLHAANTANTAWPFKLGYHGNNAPRMLVTDGIANGEKYRYRFYSLDLSTGYLTVCAANAKPFAVVNNHNVTALTEYVTPILLGGSSNRTLFGYASEAIAAGKDVYVTTAGAIMNQPLTAGVYWRVGRALTAATQVGDTVEYTNDGPSKVVIIAASTATDTALAVTSTNSTAYGFNSAAEFNAQQTCINHMLADIKAIYAGMVASDADSLEGPALIQPASSNTEG